MNSHPVGRLQNLLIPLPLKADLIHISVLPWLNFSAFSHAFSEGESLGIPKFVFGQFDKHTGTMPLAIDVHHSLMDGLHVAKFINTLQNKVF